MLLAAGHCKKWTERQNVLYVVRTVISLITIKARLLKYTVHDVSWSTTLWLDYLGGHDAILNYNLHFPQFYSPQKYLGGHKSSSSHSLQAAYQDYVDCIYK